MNQSFPQALAYVLVSEGGFVNDPLDPGGATNHGITQHEYDSWRAALNEELQSVTLITDDEVAAIYKARYWNAVSGDQLPAGVDYCVFDFAVNSGPIRAIRYLQQAAGADVDGVLGHLTLAAVWAADPKKLIGDISTGRLNYLEELKTFGHFGHGWTERVDEVEVHADAMVA